MPLDAAFLDWTRHKIESAVIPSLEAYYGHGRLTFDDAFRPGLKYAEKIVSYYDYYACGVSVAAAMAARGDARAMRLVERILDHCDHYRTAIYGQPLNDERFSIPLRRILFHLALAYRHLESRLTDGRKRQFKAIIDDQVPVSIEHNNRFFPGVKDLHLTSANNHTAIFMQGIFYCGKIFNRPEWMDITREFGERYLASAHPDGYFEEHTNADREGGPSMIYTPLSAGCVFDVLDGGKNHREFFTKAGRFFREFVNNKREMIPLADERTNCHSKSFSYGIALHSLTAQGRRYIHDSFSESDFSTLSPEGLAVIYHELDLMETGECATPEYLTDGAFRLSLPIGVIRSNGFTASLSALKALNREVAPRNDYALDHQSMVYLHHRDMGVILSGIKSKRNPEFSTFRIGDDAYPVRTGTLSINSSVADALLHYSSFDARIRWEISERPVLTLSTDDDREVTTTLTFGNIDCIRSDTPFERVILDGFSPYTAGNRDENIPAIRFVWKQRLQIPFDVNL